MREPVSVDDDPYCAYCGLVQRRLSRLIQTVAAAAERCSYLQLNGEAAGISRAIAGSSVAADRWPLMSEDVNYLIWKNVLLS